MNGSPTLNSGGVSTNAGILGWHIPAIPCDAVLRREKTPTRAPQKKHLLSVTDTPCSSREQQQQQQDEQQQQHRQSRAEQEDLSPASPMLFSSFCYDAVFRCAQNVVESFLREGIRTTDISVSLIFTLLGRNGLL